MITGRSVFNRRVQCGLYSKEDTASPFVLQDAFFHTSIIGTIEGRDKAVTDIKGAYLNAKMKDTVYMKIVGKEVDLFCEIENSFEKYATLENKKRYHMNNWIKLYMGVSNQHFYGMNCIPTL